MSAGAEFAPMGVNDLDWVARNEAELHVSPWTRGNFADALTAGYLSRVLRLDGQRVAYAVVLMVLDEAHLLNIGVARPAQGNGLGALLLRHLHTEVRRIGATQFFLEVRPSNAPALALYERSGFVPIGRRRHYYRAAGGGREDAIVMRLVL